MSIDNKSSITNHVEIVVHATTANLGPLFDIAGAALQSPYLIARLERSEVKGIKLKYISRSITPSGRKRGFAGVLALKNFMQKNKISDGVLLSFKESASGYPTGGTGLSGAEAAGAIIACAVLFNRTISRDDAVVAAAKGEPSEHMDNVAPSILGGIILIGNSETGKNTFEKIIPPHNLGFAMGFSSHKKVGGTKKTRNILNTPIESKIFTSQSKLIASTVSAFQSKDVDRILSLIWRDKFHEPHRADAGVYGDFNAKQFNELKIKLFENYKITLTVSGAGPNMGFWFDKKIYSKGLTNEVSNFIREWFLRHGIELNIENVGLSSEGAYEYALKNYPNSELMKI